MTYEQLMDYLRGLTDMGIYGLPAPLLVGAVLFCISVVYFFSATERSFLEKFVDFLVVWLSIFLFFGCLFTGMYFGKDYDQYAMGGVAGIFVFWLVFHLFTLLKQSIAEAEEKKRMKRRFKNLQE